VVRNPSSIVDQVTGVAHSSAAKVGVEGEVSREMAASLGGEFAVAMDGALVPVPSWRLVAEVYNPGRFQAALDRRVAAANLESAKAGHPPLRTARETLGGRTYYMLGAGVPNPLTEAHYTFAGGYLIAAPTRALVSRSLDVQASRASIMRSSRFVSLTPRDRYANFSAVIYQNMGTTLAPFAGLLGSLGGQNAKSQRAIESLGNLKPLLVALYAEPGQITVATGGGVFGMSLANLLTGDPKDWASSLMPFGQMAGTGGSRKAYVGK